MLALVFMTFEFSVKNSSLSNREKERMLMSMCWLIFACVHATGVAVMVIVLPSDCDLLWKNFEELRLF
jgi:hypothetical protein